MANDVQLDNLLIALAKPQWISLLSQVTAVTVRQHKGKPGGIVWYVNRWTPDLQSQFHEFETALQLQDLRLSEGAKAQFVQIGSLQVTPSVKAGPVAQAGAAVALAGRATFGTVSGILTDSTGLQYLLSCRHALDGKKGDNVVLPQADGTDPWVATLTSLSCWRLGVSPSPANTTDFALATLRKAVSATPGHSGQMAPEPAQGLLPGVPLLPLRDLKAADIKAETTSAAFVQFPLGQFTLSKMWLLKSSKPDVPVAKHGDSGSLFVYRAGNKLVPAAIAVAVTAEYTKVIDGKRRKRPGPSAVLACPVINIFNELQIPGLKFS